MELSAAGDRIFAAEAILKRRVRKVSDRSSCPACFDFPNMLVVVSTTRHCSGSLAWDCLLSPM